MDLSVEKVATMWRGRFLAAGIDALDLDRIIARVGSWADWSAAWCETADTYEQLAQKALERGNLLTAGAFLQSASLLVHFARIGGDADGKLQRRQLSLYESAAPMLVPPATRVNIPSAVGDVPGYLRYPTNQDTSAIVVILPGLDSVKEQLSAWEPYFLERGVATLSLDGPGQGEMQDLPYREDEYTKSMASVAEYVRTLPRVDALRVVVMGVSVGGYLALKSYTAVKSVVGIRAIVEFGGPYSLDMAHCSPLVYDGFMRLVGATDRAEAERLLAGQSLADTLGGIDVPVLVAHGGKDDIVPLEDAYRIHREIGVNAELYIEPLAKHNMNDHHRISRPQVADWVRERVTA